MQIPTASTTHRYLRSVPQLEREMSTAAVHGDDGVHGDEV
jgi:hypothetical protein